MIRCNLSRILGERRIHILELQRQTKVSYTTLSNLYHEKTARIDFNTIDAICKSLSIQVGDLLEYIETEGKKGKETKSKRGSK